MSADPGRLQAKLEHLGLGAAADEVSGAVAHLFSAHGAGFQALAGQASVAQGQFVQNLKASVGAYTSGEAANAAGLVPYWLSQLFSTVDTLLRSLLPLQLQQLIGSLEGFIAFPLILAVLLGSFGFAYLLVQIQQLLAPFGL